MAERGLSGTTPSLDKLKQPVAEDPNNSLHKKARGYINPNAISYVQTTYR